MIDAIADDDSFFYLIRFFQLKFRVRCANSVPYTIIINDFQKFGKRKMGDLIAVLIGVEFEMCML